MHIGLQIENSQSIGLQMEYTHQSGFANTLPLCRVGLLIEYHGIWACRYSGFVMERVCKYITTGVSLRILLEYHWSGFAGKALLRSGFADGETPE